MSVSHDCRNSHKLGGLKQQNVIFSQFWRPEAQNQGKPKIKVCPELCSLQKLGQDSS